MKTKLKEFLKGAGISIIITIPVVVLLVIVSTLTRISVIEDLALASVIVVPVLFIYPFLIWKKKWWMMLGALAGPMLFAIVFTAIFETTCNDFLGGCF